jgi:predicted ester cyclase
MSAEKDQATVRRYYLEVFNQKKESLLDELAVPDYVEHNPFPGHGQGIAGLYRRVGMLQSAFLANFTIEDMIVEGDKIVVRWANHVVHHGTFFGIPATGKPATVQGIDIIRMRDGKMAEHWDVVDILSVLQQLGAFPQPAAPGA